MVTKDLNWWVEKIRKNEIKLKKIKVKESAIESITKGAPLATTGISEILGDIEKGDLVEILSPREKIISIGFALIDSKEMVHKKVICFKPNLFIWELINDQSKINETRENFIIHPNALGIPGTDLFPITIDVINREEMPGGWKWHGYNEALCVVYYGICPELENFVSLILWPHESANPEYINASRKAYQKIYDLVINDPQHQKVIFLSGNYRLSLPNEIRPYKSEISSISKPKAVYDWLYAPYLKEVSETILSHKSPLNFTRIFLREPNNVLVTKYVNFKTTVGKFIEKRASTAKFGLIQIKKYIICDKCKSSFWLEENVLDNWLCDRCNNKVYKTIYPKYEIKIHHSILSKFSSIEKGNLVALLIGETINEKPQPVLMDIEKIKSIDVFSHIILYKLYNIFLDKKRLLLMSLDEFKDLFNKYLRITANFCRGLDYSIGFGIDTFFEFHLSYFFKKIDENIFYVPSILSKPNSQDIKLFDSRLREDKENLFDTQLVFDEKGNIRRDVEKLQRKYDLLRFLIKMKLLIYRELKQNEE